MSVEYRWCGSRNALLTPAASDRRRRLRRRLVAPASGVFAVAFRRIETTSKLGAAMATGRADDNGRKQDSPERFDPTRWAGGLIEAEHRARYWWAAH